MANSRADIEDVFAPPFLLRGIDRNGFEDLQVRPSFGMEQARRDAEAMLEQEPCFVRVDVLSQLGMQVVFSVPAKVSA